MSIRFTFRSTVKRICRPFSWGICGGTLLAVLGPGCTALHPLRGVPASYLPDQFEGPSRDNKRTIDLSLLVRTPPDQHRVAAGDVLSVYIPRVLGSQPTEVSSAGLEPPINMPASIEDPPTVGYPIQVRDDNTIALPQIPPLPVGGMTLHQVEQAVRKAYSVDHRILNPEEAMVLVSLQRPRIHRVLVVRQEANATLTTSTQPGSVNIGTTGKGTARTVTLKAYENDVLHALAQGDGVDGLPGLNAENVIYIIRRRPRGLNPVGCPPFGPETAPVQAPVMPDGGFNLPQPTPAMHGASTTRPRSASGIQLVSYEQVAAPGPQQPMIPPPYGTYRGTSEQAAHSLMSRPSLPPNSTAANSSMVVPAPYAATSSGVTQTQYQQSPIPYPQSFNTPIAAPQQYDQQLPPQQQFSSQQPFPPAANYPVLPPNAVNGSPLPVESGGHSWGALPPAPTGQPADGVPMADLGWNSMLADFDPTIDNPNIIRIPIRLGPGEQPNITEEQITLYDGDIIFIDSRETEVFYTAGLLGGGQYTLPRDYDLGVLEAVSIAEGRTMGGGGTGYNRAIGGVSALNHDVSNSASRLAILRTLPNGKRITIEVDLNKAMRYQQENIRIQPGDILFLEYTFPEAVCAFTNRYLFEGALFSLAASQFQSR